MGELMDKVRGRLKQIGGQLSGNRRLQTKGEVEETKGEAKEKFEDLKRDVRDTTRSPRTP